MSKHIELAKKLKALSEKGIGGEKKNAEKMLLDFITKHKITISDIDGEEIKNFFFTIEESYFDLFYQIVKSVNRSIKVYRFPKKEVRQFRLKGNHEIECTIAEYIEIEQSYDIYIKLYKEELKTFYEAFIHANSIYPKTSPEEMRSVDELSEEEQEKWIRKVSMAHNIKKATIRKQLNQ